jgi:hypothetical protein
MAVTVSREGGPTVPVAYDPRRGKEHVPDWTRHSELFVLGTMVSIGQQLGTATSSWLKDVLSSFA